MQKLISLALLSSLLSGCGDSGSSTTAFPVNNANNQVNITISSNALTIEKSVSDETPQNIEGIWVSSSINANQIFLQAYDPSGRFQVSPIVSGAPDANFNLRLYSVATLASGTYQGNLLVKACKTATCSSVYTSNTAKLAYTITVKADSITDWSTFQGNAAHQGYQAIAVNPARFKEVWKWQRSDNPSLGINHIATSKGKVYIADDAHSGQVAQVHSLAEADGHTIWETSLGNMPSLSGPAVDQGKVYVAVAGHGDSKLWTFNAETGVFINKSAFESQWGNVLNPTIYDNKAYIVAGYYGGLVYAYSTADGAKAWTSAAMGDGLLATPAVDNQYLYFHSGADLNILNRQTGLLVSSILDPYGSITGYDYHGAPVLGGRNNVFAFSGSGFSGLASGNAEQYEQRVFTSFNINTKSYEWSSSNAYLTAPAVANGIIYAGRNEPMSFDAINEATGAILWSWTPPADAGDTSFHRNVVLTKNLAFVSTDKAVYALDLETKRAVWSYPKPGMLAISADRTLYIATGVRLSDGGLVAIRLKE
jgi:hypothetical protein